METSCIPALAYSGADLLHGPPAMVGNVSPVIAVIAVIAVVPDGKGGEALQPVLDRLRGRGADLFVVGPAAQVEAAPAGFVLPTDGARGAPADPGDPSAPAAGVRGDHRQGPGPVRPEGCRRG